MFQDTHTQTREEHSWFQAFAGKRMKTALFCVITQRIVGESLPTFRYILSGPIFKDRSLDPWRWDPIVRTETSVRDYHYSLCNNPEESSSRGINIEWLFAVFVCVEVVISGRRSRLHETCMPLAWPDRTTWLHLHMTPRIITLVVLIGGTNHFLPVSFLRCP